jgi:hypothetical protein
MGEKYASIRAGVAGVAPAAFGFQWSEDQKLKNVPLLIILGEDDTPVTGSQQPAEQLKGLDFHVEYKSLPGLDHAGIIGGSMPDVSVFSTNIPGQDRNKKEVQPYISCMQ